MKRLLKLLAAIPAALVLILTLTPPGTAGADVDVYVTPGRHTVNGREWNTTCEPYSQVQRCRTTILATQVSEVGGRFLAKTEWVFNNLTYTAGPRSLWRNNPLGANGVVNGRISWTAEDGRKWRTECDTAITGRNGCRSYIVASVIEAYRTAAGSTAYRWVSKEIFNNMVRFSTSTTPTTPPSANVVEPYVLKGRVTDSAGRPLAGVEVGARNPLLYNSNLITRTDSSGYYRIALNVNTTWKPWAYLTKSYQGYTYRLDLYSDLSAFATQTGAVRNFQWRLTGQHPEISDAYYGGTAEFFESWDSAETIDDWSRVRVTFRPIGPLIDGSTGKVITRNLTDALVLRDLPVGKYRITASYTRSSGTVVPLRVTDFRGSEPLATSVDMVLPPWDVLDGVIIVEVGF